jgi:UDP-glucose 4-epimerase
VHVEVYNYHLGEAYIKRGDKDNAIVSLTKAAKQAGPGWDIAVMANQSIQQLNSNLNVATMNILVVGGAGYIGSHMVKHLDVSGHKVTTLDNLSKGYRDAVTRGEFVKGDLANRDQLSQLMSSNKFDAVMHFASFIEVAESVREPARYYQNNVTNTQHLLDAMVASGINHLIFSSTAAVFGEPQYTPIDEAHPKFPINPYGKSKLIVEKMLEDYDSAYNLKSVCLRYFNAAGADIEGELGERHYPETHLIPLVLQAASGRRDTISIFGNDYDTPDGTCVRDYIHVQDLCDAHILALDYLRSFGDSDRFNLGNGRGFSVQQVVDCARKVTGREISVKHEASRAGDSAILVADSTRARQQMGWKPEFSSLEKIIETAWNWEQSFLLQ